MLTKLLKDLTQLALRGEMDAHIAESSLGEGGNRLYGTNNKIMKTPSGTFELEVPKDRNSSFEPELIKKRQTILTSELDSSILALYGIGASY